MWEQLDKYTNEFLNCGLNAALDFEQFNRIAIVHHSSAIEGSTLTLEESALLISEGITAKGKPMSEHFMVTDHHKALLLCLSEAKKKTSVTPELLKQINALVNKNNGQVRQTPLGTCDDTKGDLRLGNVTAGTTYFVNYDKVPQMTSELCKKIQEKINSAKTNKEIYQLSFDAHYYLVTIHPWFDGNGRSSRLLMNYIQAWNNKPFSVVFTEDKAAYIKALNDARAADDAGIFNLFMCEHHIKYMKQEIDRYKQRNNGISFLL